MQPLGGVRHQADIDHDILAGKHFTDEVDVVFQVERAGAVRGVISLCDAHPVVEGVTGVIEEGEKLGKAPDWMSSYLPFETGWRVMEWTESIYASTYVVVLLVPLLGALRKRAEAICAAGADRYGADVSDVSAAACSSSRTAYV